uniref:Uncharacterized protein n=1 Tax=Cacopsylla melanoneura TaxID=428564 RepID=A0A8D8WRR4_9HEMI
MIHTQLEALYTAGLCRLFSRNKCDHLESFIIAELQIPNNIRPLYFILSDFGRQCCHLNLLCSTSLAFQLNRTLFRVAISWSKTSYTRCDRSTQNHIIGM